MTAVEQFAERIKSLTPAEVAALRGSDLIRNWPPHMVNLLERVIAEHLNAGWRRDPLSFGIGLEPGLIRRYRHVEYLSERFRAAVLGQSRFQVWNLPQQTFKSTTLRLGLAWALDHDPTLPLIYTGYSNDLSRDGAVFVRDLANNHRDKIRFQLKPDVRRADQWKTTEGGGLLAHGIAAGLAGYPARGVVVDDPLENWQKAHSKAHRDAVWSEFTAVARFRLAPDGFLILAHARWHVDDPTGRMLELAAEMGVEVEFVTLPMLAEADDILGRAIGDPLVPERYDADECVNRAAWMGGYGSYLHQALEQQHPIPESGGELRRDRWQWYDHVLVDADQWLASWDMKLKDRRGGDYVVGLVLARIGGNVYVVDMLRDHFTLAETKVAIAWTYLLHPQVSTQVVENTGNGPEVMSELAAADPTFVLDDATADRVGIPTARRPEVEAFMRHGVHGLVPENVSGDKTVRARTYIVPRLAGLNLWLPTGARWPALIVDEAAGFPPKAGGHDDIVDALSQGIKHLTFSTPVVATTRASAVAMPSPGASAMPGARRRY